MLAGVLRLGESTRQGRRDGCHCENNAEIFSFACGFRRRDMWSSTQISQASRSELRFLKPSAYCFAHLFNIAFLPQQHSPASYNKDFEDCKILVQSLNSPQPCQNVKCYKSTTPPTSVSNPSSPTLIEAKTDTRITQTPQPSPEAKSPKASKRSSPPSASWPPSP